MRCTELSISHKRKERKTKLPGVSFVCLFVCLFVVLAVMCVWLCDRESERAWRGF